MSGLGKDGSHGLVPKRSSKGVVAMAVVVRKNQHWKKIFPIQVVSSTKEVRYFLTVLLKTSTCALH
jgi:hypothetical protein